MGGGDEMPIGTYKIDTFTSLVARIQNRYLWAIQLNIILMISNENTHLDASFFEPKGQ
jgi:hypothetical protein